MKHALLDLGEFVRGVAIDEIRWGSESRIRRLHPKRLASGTVETIYPLAPTVVGIRQADGEHAVIVTRPRSTR